VLCSANLLAHPVALATDIELGIMGPNDFRSWMLCVPVDSTSVPSSPFRRRCLGIDRHCDDLEKSIILIDISLLISLMPGQGLRRTATPIRAALAN
jgi:hypothetical protein